MLIIVIQIVVWFIIINYIKIYLTNDLEKNKVRLEAGLGRSMMKEGGVAQL